jgi:hypothetical protein
MSTLLYDTGVQRWPGDIVRAKGTPYSVIRPEEAAAHVSAGWATYAPSGLLTETVTGLPASYVVAQDASGTILARNAQTGAFEFSGTDAATVINAALAACAATGGTVQLSDGTYTLTAPLQNDASYVSLVGMGLRRGAYLTVASGASLACMLQWGVTQNVTGCRIANLGLNGVHNTNAAGDGILLFGGDCTLRDLRVQQMPRDGIHYSVQSGTLFDNYTENCYVIQCGRDAYVIDNGVSSSEWHLCRAAGGTGATPGALGGRLGFYNQGYENKFSLCHPYFFTNHGFFQTRGGATQIVGGEYETNGQHGIYLQASAGAINDVRISGSSFYGNNVTAGTNTQDALVNPTANTPGMDIYVDGTSNAISQLSISECHFHTAGGGTQASNNIQLSQATYYTVRGCCFAGAPNAALRTTNFAQYGTIDSNVFGGGAGSAIFLDGNTASTRVSGNVLSRSVQEHNSTDYTTFEGNVLPNGSQGSVTLLGAHSISRNNRGVQMGQRTLTASTTLSSMDFGGMVLVSTNSSLTMTLPSAASAGLGSQTITIKNGSGVTSTTVASAGGTIDGASTYTLASAFSAVTVQSDGANWFIVNKI